MIINTNQDNFIKLIPQNSGVYRFFAIDDSVLYVGKAINLYKRVVSYFKSNKNMSPRIKIMVSKIVKMELTITNNEYEALILEINLIKSLKPKYNIIFRDDKTYPYIRFTQHNYPKIEYYRSKNNNNDKTFGPYTDSNAVKKMIDLLQKIFLLRTCSDNYYNNRIRPCMLYQIKRCSAPCVGYIEQTSYQANIDFAQKFLRGEERSLLNQLTLKMNQCSNQLEFEESAKIRDIIFSIKEILKKQRVVFENKINLDIIHHIIDQNQLYVYIINIKNGLYVNDNNFKINIYDDDISQSILILLENIYLNNLSKKVIYLNIALNKSQKSYLKNILNLTILKKEYKNIHELIDLANENLEKIIAKPKFTEAWAELEKLLNLSNIRKIECIDVSHHQGESCIASIVVAEDGNIKNSEYRRYNLSSDINGNDILAMEDIVTKRYIEKKYHPDIILIDGGILQYKAIKNILSKDNNCDKIILMTIFKGHNRDPKLDKVIINPTTILELKDSPILFGLLQHLRDEAHRFAITGHRIKQEKKMSHTILLEINNVGVNTRKLLLSHFGSVKSIAKASIDELKLVKGVGDELAKNIYSFFH
jgi:excinuclease ABC subunit C